MRNARVGVAIFTTIFVLVAMTGCLFLNQAPRSSFAVNPSVGVAPLTVELNAEMSMDPDGVIDAYVWAIGFPGGGKTFVGGTARSTYTFDIPGAYEVSLMVTDDDGSLTTSTQSVVVTEADSRASDLLAIVEWELFFDEDRFGTWVVEGRARNLSNQTLSSSAINALFYDDNDEVVATGVTFEFDLLPEEEWTFAIPLGNQLVVDAVRYCVPAVAAANI